MAVIMVVTFILMFGLVSPFLLQEGANSTLATYDRSYQDLVSMIVDEQHSRRLLELTITSLSGKLLNMESAMTYMGTTIQTMNSTIISQSDRIDYLDRLTGDMVRELGKEQSNRAQLQQMYTGIMRDLVNVSNANEHLNGKVHQTEGKLLNLTSAYNTCLKTQHTEYLNITEAFEKITIKLHLVENETGILHNATVVDRIEALENNIYTLNNTVSAVKVVQNELQGNVKTQGLQAGFSVRRPNKITTTRSLLFELIMSNYGNGYNETTGIFSCQHSGVYLITSTIVREPGILEAYCAIYLNDIAKTATVSTGGDTQGYISGTADLIQHLNRGDQLSLGHCSGNSHMNEFSSFSAILVVPDSS